MDSSLCVSKSDLLDWLRSIFNYNIVKVEECGNGVVYLMILDALFPGKVPMRKIKQNAKQEWECLHNLKLLQTVFMEQGIKKNLDINRLAKCVYSDNLEFLQWLKRFYDRHTLSNGMRDINHNGTSNSEAVSGSTIAHNMSNSQRSQRIVKPTSRQDGPSSRPHTTNSRLVTAPSLAPNRGCHVQGSRKDSHMLEDEVEKLRYLVKQREQEIEALRQELQDTEAESRFYFGKLRAFEMLAGEPHRAGFTIPEVETILFAEDNFTEEELIEAVLNKDQLNIDAKP